MRVHASYTLHFRTIIVALTQVIIGNLTDFRKYGEYNVAYRRNADNVMRIASDYRRIQQEDERWARG